MLTAVGGILFGYDTGVVGGVLPNISKRLQAQRPVREGPGRRHPARRRGRRRDRRGPRSPTSSAGAARSSSPASCSSSACCCPRWRPRCGCSGSAASSSAWASARRRSSCRCTSARSPRPERRGGLVSLNQLSVTIGILVSQLVAYFLAGHGDWRVSVGLALLPAVVLGLGHRRASPRARRGWSARAARTRPAPCCSTLRETETRSRTRSRTSATSPGRRARARSATCSTGGCARR